ncbi:MAG: hypothetical protein V4532_06105 [Pseudomonadota bacterium]
MDAAVINGLYIALTTFLVVVTTVIQSWWQRRMAVQDAELLARKVDLVAEKTVKKADEVKEALVATSKTKARKIDELTEAVSATAMVIDTIEQQGNSKWEHLQAQLNTALEKIEALQQQRVDDAKGRIP